MLSMRNLSRLPRLYHTLTLNLTRNFRVFNSRRQRADVTGKGSCEQRLPTYHRDLWYPAKKGEIVNARYKIIEKIGYGKNATAWLSRDLSKAEPTYTSLKILANLQDGAEERETAAQKHLACISSSHPGQHLVQHQLDTFLVQGPSTNNRCFIYPLMSTDLLYFNEFKFDTSDIEHFKWVFKQILLALDFLHTEANIVHTDLKLDSIMLKYGLWKVLPSIERKSLDGKLSARSVIDDEVTIYHGVNMLPTTSHGPPLLCDFGQARIGTIMDWEGDIQPQLMRAPEVVMRMSWDHKIDIWNAGCLLWNLCLNVHLFENVDPKVVFSDDYDAENKHKYQIYEPVDPRKYVAAITSVIGPPPTEFLLKARPCIDNYFDTNGQWLHGETHPLIETSLTALEGGCDSDFVDLVSSMLQWLPERRKTAKELLDHPFLRNVKQPDPLLPYVYQDYDYEELQRLTRLKPHVCW